MIHTENFKTRTEIRARQNPKKQGFWDIGLDIGYSGVKGFSPNKVFCFPAFAKKVPEGLVSIAKPSDKDIQYKNLETGDIWDVGEAAQARATTNDSELALFGRVRYYSEMFQVLAKVGFALSLMENKFGAPDEDIISVETGLPPEYIKSDTGILKEALAGEHHCPGTAHRFGDEICAVRIEFLYGLNRIHHLLNEMILSIIIVFECHIDVLVDS